MSKLAWGTVGNRFYETGVDRGVLYPQDQDGVAWDGLVRVDVSPNDSAPTGYYQDGYRYLTSYKPEERSGTIEAFTYPNEFEQCDGTLYDQHGVGYHQQSRIPFGFSYRTRIGNDLDGVDHGYKINLIYNASASPSSRSNKTISSALAPTTFTWDFVTIPEAVSGYLPTAHLVIDSRRIDPDFMRLFEDILYGTDRTNPSLLLPNEVSEFFSLPLSFFETSLVSETGLNPLFDSDNPDVFGYKTEGLYRRTTDSRLRKTDEDGFYILE